MRRETFKQGSEFKNQTTSIKVIHHDTLCLDLAWVSAMIEPAIKRRFMEMKIQFSHIVFLKEALTTLSLLWSLEFDQTDQRIWFVA